MARSTLPGTAEEVPTGLITGGVDTHLDVHVAAALDQIGGLLGTASFATTPTREAGLAHPRLPEVWALLDEVVVQVPEVATAMGMG